MLPLFSAKLVLQEADLAHICGTFLSWYSALLWFCLESCFQSFCHSLSKQFQTLFGYHKSVLQTCALQLKRCHHYSFDSNIPDNSPSIAMSFPFYYAHQELFPQIVCTESILAVCKLYIHCCKCQTVLTFLFNKVLQVIMNQLQPLRHNLLYHACMCVGPANSLTSIPIFVKFLMLNLFTLRFFGRNLL